MKHYSYEGPVMGAFNNIVINKWYAETYAESFKQAISNLCYRYKIQHGLIKTSKITLVNKIKEL